LSVLFLEKNSPHAVASQLRDMCSSHKCQGLFFIRVNSHLGYDPGDGSHIWFCEPEYVADLRLDWEFNLDQLATLGVFRENDDVVGAHRYLDLGGLGSDVVLQPDGFSLGTFINWYDPVSLKENLSDARTCVALRRTFCSSSSTLPANH